MLGKYPNIFRSRWKALWWAAGVLLTAYCTVPSAERAETDAAGRTAKPHEHINPWVLDPKK